MRPIHHAPAAWLAAAIALGAACGARELPPAPAAPPVRAAPRASETLDQHLVSAWREAGVVPAPPADDFAFFRRLHLDLVGTLPSPEEVLAFAADGLPGKRARAVDALLASPAFSSHLARLLEGSLIRRGARRRVIDAEAWRRWLEHRLAEGAGWDAVVGEIVTASGSSLPGGEGSPEPNPAVHYLLQFERRVEDAAGAVARDFLGVQAQCAQCHDHKSEPITQEDFRRFAANFAAMRVLPAGRSGERRGFVLRDAERPVRGREAGPVPPEVARAEPAALFGAALPEAETRRASLAAWMTAKESPALARAFTNRLWAHFFGRGFVDPVDDLRPSNPPVLPAALDALSRRFAERGFDVRALVRDIVLSEAYVRGPSLGATRAEQAERARRLFAVHRPRPLPPAVLLDALVAASGASPLLESTLGSRLPALRDQTRRRFEFTFEVDEDARERDAEATLPQAWLLQNGRLVAIGTSALPGTALRAILDGIADDGARVRALYLRTLSRPPSPEELERWVELVRAAEAEEEAAPPRKGKGRLGRARGLAALERRARSAPRTPKERAYEDLFWALVNSSEFVFNH